MNNLTEKVVAVTGGAGLIGSFLSERLVARGAKVVIIDDFSKGLYENLEAIKDDVVIKEGDLEDPAFANKAFVGCEYVFHLASRAYGVGYSKDHHIEMLLHNERITNNIVSALSLNRPLGLLVASSSCVYDDDGPDLIPELPLFDGQPEWANRGYGWAKRFLEQKAILLGEELQFPVIIARPFNIYGERYNWMGQYSQAIPMLVKKVMDGDDPVVIWGSGKQKRTYIHALDCAEIMIQLMEAGYKKNAVNIGTEYTTSMSDLVKLISKLGEKFPELIFDKSKPEGRYIKSSNTEILKSVLPDFEMSINIEYGLSRMISWYHNNFK